MSDACHWVWLLMSRRFFRNPAIWLDMEVQANRAIGVALIADWIELDNACGPTWRPLINRPQRRPWKCKFRCRNTRNIKLFKCVSVCLRCGWCFKCESLMSCANQWTGRCRCSRQRLSRCSDVQIGGYSRRTGWLAEIILCAARWMRGHSIAFDILMCQALNYGPAHWFMWICVLST